jgi:V-type H+-transporting ATPase subunit C
MPGVIVPTSGHNLMIEDKDGNIIYRYVVYKAQAEDAIKALRRKGYTSKVFSYDRASWENENAQRIILKDQLEVKTTLLNETARSCFQQTFVALMHLKVVRAYIDGVLRFGIPPRFYLGIVVPKKG